MPARISLIFLTSFSLTVVAVSGGGAQTVPAPPPLSLSALIDQTLASFPKVDGEVLEVQGPTLTLSLGARAGVPRGLALEVVREGREIRHPKTGQVLGKAERPIGRAVVTQVADVFSFATLEGEPAQVGDRVRTSARVKLTLLALSGTGIRANLVEAVTSEIYEGLNRTGRFQITLGEQLGVWLVQEKISPDEFLQGRGVRQAAERFKADNILAVYVKQMERRPFLEARLFTTGRPDTALTTAFFVPPSIKPVQPGRFSASDRNQLQGPERKQRSFLARLLGGDAEPGAYSSAESSIPLREIARLGFTVHSMDVTVAPADQIPRVVLTDGDRIWVYKLVDQKFEGDWTYHTRIVGRIISVQLADLDGDGTLEVVANRFDTRVGMHGVIVGLRNGKPVALVDSIDTILLALDEGGSGVKRTLWSQKYRPETFFNKGQIDEVAVKGGSLVKVKTLLVPDTFRATGATFSNVNGKDSRVLAFIDEQGRLRIASGHEEMWRSSSTVGGGGERIEVIRDVERGGRSFFHRMEPTPLSVDLDGDGIHEIVVPQNQLETGLLAIVYRGPAGLRFQQVNSGFEGLIRALGAIPGEGGAAPTLIAAIVRHKNFLRVAGETQLIMTVQE